MAVQNLNPNPYPVGTPASQLPPGAPAPDANAPASQPQAPAPAAAPAPLAVEVPSVGSTISADFHVAMQIVAQVLTDVNSLLAGKPVSVQLPAESFSLGNITITIPATAVQVTYSATAAEASALASQPHLPA